MAISWKGVWLTVVGLVLPAVVASTASGYIHFPPMTLQKMCQISMHIRVLTLKKHSKEKGVLLFDAVENLKGGQSQTKGFKHVLRSDAASVKPILDWAGDDKRAVMFWIEGSGIACGYVFIDEYCYSVDYNWRGDFWLMIRADPQMSACYHGSAEGLGKLVTEVLAGKDVKVPVKSLTAPINKQDRENRADEVNKVLKKNRQ